MADYHYSALKVHEKILLAMTSLTVKEFESLLPAFKQAYEADLLARGKRVDETRGRSKGQLALIEDKLLFILFYLKTYPLQEVLAYSFGLPQSTAHHWIQRLSRVLRAALAEQGELPVRVSAELAERLAREGTQVLSMDATERRRQRPQDPALQREYYSGKKKDIP
ncbi:helix-turn-helix domain-containing protein [Thiofilum flexile]|uniref:helix-turn-helix domain-containing protein n=1 Tax=Thiofilum flexile TaxID=125627 RepID=UPI00036F2A70|nr:transposase family protein [Thiofilum flexile]